MNLFISFLNYLTGVSLLWLLHEHNNDDDDDYSCPFLLIIPHTTSFWFPVVRFTWLNHGWIDWTAIKLEIQTIRQEKQLLMWSMNNNWLPSCSVLPLQSWSSLLSWTWSAVVPWILDWLISLSVAVVALLLRLPRVHRLDEIWDLDPHPL